MRSHCPAREGSATGGEKREKDEQICVNVSGQGVTKNCIKIGTKKGGAKWERQRRCKGDREEKQLRLSLFCVVLVSVFAALFLVQSKAGAADHPKTLKIGALVCMTGWFSNYDIQTGLNGLAFGGYDQRERRHRSKGRSTKFSLSSRTARAPWTG